MWRCLRIRVQKLCWPSSPCLCFETLAIILQKKPYHVSWLARNVVLVRDEKASDLVDASVLHAHFVCDPRVGFGKSGPRTDPSRGAPYRRSSVVSGITQVWSQIQRRNASSAIETGIEPIKSFFEDENINSELMLEASRKLISPGKCLRYDFFDIYFLNADGKIKAERQSIVSANCVSVKYLGDTVGTNTCKPDFTQNWIRDQPEPWRQLDRDGDIGPPYASSNALSLSNRAKGRKARLPQETASQIPKGIVLFRVTQLYHPIYLYFYFDQYVDLYSDLQNDPNARDDSTDDRVREGFADHLRLWKAIGNGPTDPDDPIFQDLHATFSNVTLNSVRVSPELYPYMDPLMHPAQDSVR